MIVRIAAAALAVTLPSLGSAASWPGPEFPDFKQPAEIRQQCDKGLSEAAERLRQMEQHAPDAAWLPAFDAFNAWIEDRVGPVGFLTNVHPEAAMRDAAQHCETRWDAFHTALNQNARLYAAARAVQPADDIDRGAMREVLDDFVDAGVALPPAKRVRAKALQDRINLLAQQFDRNLRDDRTRLPFDMAALDGVPEGILKDAPRDPKGRVLLGLDYPIYFPVMEQARDATTRERMWRAANSRGGTANLRLLSEIARLRMELAALFGHKSYADFVLRRRMAGNVHATQRFLDEVKASVRDGELQDLAVLRDAKARHLGQPLAATTLRRWDVAFYTERVRKERFDVDAAQFRPYFPPEASLAFVMRVAERMFDIRYERVEGQRLWHPDAQAYAVTDAKTGKPLAGLFVDLYPREGKYGHAAVSSFRSGSTLAGRLPQAGLMVNFDRRGLTLDELETLLHEFGHALHSNLSATRYAMQSGTAVKRDFVEAPSQMLEDWVYDPRVLALFQEVCPTCQPVPPALIAQAREARDFGKGGRTARQHLYASFDLALHGPKLADPMKLWAQMEQATPLGHVPGTQFPAGFGHVAGGYAAGYYGYLWSLVLATDLRTAFAADHLDPVVGRRYRDTVLSMGGQRQPAQLMRDFLGRESSPKAFFDELKH